MPWLSRARSAATPPALAFLLIMALGLIAFAVIVAAALGALAARLVFGACA